MEWTRDKPTQEGWYWHFSEHKYYLVLELKYGRNEKGMKGHARNSTLRILTGGWVHAGKSLMYINGLWYGPILPPDNKEVL